MQKFLGVKISDIEKDITEKLSHESLIGIPVRTDLTLRDARRLFRREFIQKTLQTNYANVSEVADLLGVNRRSIHRDIKSLKLNMRKLKERMYKRNYFQKEVVDSIIKRTLDTYRSVIVPGKLDKLYRYVPELSRDIVRFLPSKSLTLREAMREFEQTYFAKLLEETSDNFKDMAKRANVRYETLLRKLKSLGLKR